MDIVKEPQEKLASCFHASFTRNRDVVRGAYAYGFSSYSLARTSEREIRTEI